MQYSSVAYAVLLCTASGCANETVHEFQSEQQAVWGQPCVRADARLDLRHDVASQPEQGQQMTGSLRWGIEDFAIEASMESVSEGPTCNVTVAHAASETQPRNYAAFVDITFNEDGTQSMQMAWHQWSETRISRVDTNGLGSAISAVTGNGQASGTISLSDSNYAARTETVFFKRIPVVRENAGSWDGTIAFGATYPNDNGSVSWEIPGCYSFEQSMVAFAGIYCQYATTQMQP